MLKLRRLAYVTDKASFKRDFKFLRLEEIVRIPWQNGWKIEAIKERIENQELKEEIENVLDRWDRWEVPETDHPYAIHAILARVTESPYGFKKGDLILIFNLDPQRSTIPRIEEPESITVEMIRKDDFFSKFKEKTKDKGNKHEKINSQA